MIRKTTINVTRLTLAIFLFYGTISTYSFAAKKPDNPELKAKLKKPANPVSYEKLVDGLDNPWGMAFLPDGRILVTEKKGEIRIIQDGELLDKKISGLPEVKMLGQGGLMDIEPHPDYESNSWIYLTIASPRGDQPGANTGLFRAKLNGTQLTHVEWLYKASPNSERGVHFGSRIAFDAENRVYFSVGDRGARNRNPQNLSIDGGKIYRLHDDGSIPGENPFVDNPKAIDAIYSYGHRNPQGLDFHPETGQLWSHEHGPKGGDEINIIESGHNYGWPVASFGVNYNGTQLTERTSHPNMKGPVAYYTPSIAPCGMTFITGKRYPSWQNDFILGSLKFGHFVVVETSGHRVEQHLLIADGIGRARNVEQGPDGYLYVAIENDGIYRLLPPES